MIPSPKPYDNTENSLQQSVGQHKSPFHSLATTCNNSKPLSRDKPFSKRVSRLAEIAFVSKKCLPLALSKLLYHQQVKA